MTIIIIIIGAFGMTHLVPDVREVYVAVYRKAGRGVVRFGQAYFATFYGPAAYPFSDDVRYQAWLESHAPSEDR